MISYKIYNFNVNEDFVTFLISKLITCFIHGFTSGMKSKSIAYLPIRSAHIYWTLDLESEVHSIWDLWSSGLQECKGNIFSEVRPGGGGGGGGATCFDQVQNFLLRATQCGYDTSKVREGILTYALVNFLKLTILIVMGQQPMMHPRAFI